jgi:alpha-L-fucosidase
MSLSSPDLTWFHAARYGMFIHWGAYSVAGRGEWALNRERIPLAEYRARYVEAWRAESYDPEAWVALAKEAGMGYLVLTTRHHDGFALWDSAVNPFNAARFGPRRDLVAPFVHAVRRAGLKLGFYYSPAAWAHPDYPGAYFRDWPGEKDWKDEASRQRFIAYYRAELRELLTGYGPIDYLWYDGCIPGNLEGAETNTELRKIQPGMLINERNGVPCDVHISEQTVKAAAPGQAWEACLTLNNNWAYHAGDSDYKTAKNVIDLLLSTSASAGNLLLNVGPRPDGVIPEESTRILREAGRWLKQNREFLSHSDRSPFSWNSTSKATIKGDRVYLHFLADPQGSFCWAELKNRVRSVRLLATNYPVPFRQEADRLFLDLPLPLPDAPVTTVEIEVEGIPEAITPQTSFWIPG